MFKLKKNYSVLGFSLGFFFLSSLSFINAINLKHDLNSLVDSVKETSSQFTVNSEGVLVKYTGDDKEVIIPQNVKSIGFGAFMEHSEIEKIILPNDLEVIDEYAFYSCTSLKEIIIPDKVNRIGRLAFGDCSKCTRIHLGTSVKTIEEFVFWGCTSLENIEVNENNANYSSYQGLLYNKNMSDLKVCPAGKTGIINLPESVIVISGYAFFDCNNIEEIHRPGDKLIKLEVAAFYGCSKLKSIDFENNIKKIGACAFSECKSMKEFTVGEYVKSLGSSAFIECKSLKKVIFKSKNVELGHDLFARCPKNIVIIADKDSSAAIYAKRHSDKLVLV